MNKDEELESLRRHSAGAIITHRSPFENLPTPYKEGNLPRDFILRLVKPFYMPNLCLPSFQNNFALVRDELDDDVIMSLLENFDWRPRQVGAIFAAIQKRTDFVTPIGNLLLKSELCYAGRSYALALASFGTSESIAFLERYLDYYLAQADLPFDQFDVFAALIVIDRETGKRRHEAFTKRWESFIEIQRNIEQIVLDREIGKHRHEAFTERWDIERTVLIFTRQLAALRQMQTAS